MVQGKEVHNGNYSGPDFANLTREQCKAVKELRQQGEAMAASLQASIDSLVTQAVQEKLEAAIICGVANATTDNDTLTQATTASASMSAGEDRSGYSGGSKCRAQSGNVGDFLSNKKLQISFKPNSTK